MSEMPPPQRTIAAAGGLLWRSAADGTVEVAVIHRPRYDDWTLPKGKLDAGEGHEAAALREVREETGCRARLGRCLGEVWYRQRRGGVTWDKSVRYWEMEALDGVFVPGDEVDGLRWLACDEAAQALSYPRDRDVLARFRALAVGPPHAGRPAER